MAHKKHKKFITDINLFLMKITLIFLTLILIIQTTTAISIHAENTKAGVGYTNADTTIETHTDYSSGHAAVIAERGSGIVNDTISIDLSTQNKTLSIHVEVAKEYTPVSYNGKLYDRHWKYGTIVKNYIVGGIINSAYENSQNIKEESEWILNKNVTSLMGKTTYLGESHFGIRVVDGDPKNTIIDSFRDNVGLFTEERVVAIANETSPPHSLPISCP